MTTADVLKLAGWGSKSTMRIVKDKDDDTESATSFGEPITAKPTVKFAWSANEKAS